MAKRHRLFPNSWEFVKFVSPRRPKKFDTNCTNFHELWKRGWLTVLPPFFLIRVHWRDSREGFNGAFGECALPLWLVPRERGGEGEARELREWA
jgi:hypothetical protein